MAAHLQAVRRHSPGANRRRSEVKVLIGNGVPDEWVVGAVGTPREGAEGRRDASRLDVKTPG